MKKQKLKRSKKESGISSLMLEENNTASSKFWGKMIRNLKFYTQPNYGGGGRKKKCLPAYKYPEIFLIPFLRKNTCICSPITLKKNTKWGGH